MYFRNLLCKCKLVNENTTIQKQPTAKKRQKMFKMIMALFDFSLLKKSHLLFPLYRKLAPRLAWDVL